jgi:hypothetical protein
MLLYYWKRHSKIQREIISFVSASFAPFLTFFHPFRTLYSSSYLSFRRHNFEHSTSTRTSTRKLHVSMEKSWDCGRCIHGIIQSPITYVYIYIYIYIYILGNTALKRYWHTEIHLIKHLMLENHWFGTTTKHFLKHRGMMTYSSIDVK